MAVAVRAFAAARWLVAPLAALLLAAACRAQPVDIDPSTLPTFNAVLEVRQGFVALAAGRSAVDLKGRDVYARCGHTPESITEELVAFLEQRLRTGGTFLTKLLVRSSADSDPQDIDRKIKELAKVDRQTSELLTGEFDWPRAREKLRLWVSRFRAERPDLVPNELQLSDLYDEAHDGSTYGDAPMVPMAPTPGDVNPQAGANGMAGYFIAPPLVGGARKLALPYNPSEWSRVRGGLERSVLSRFECKLWRGDRLVVEIQDYLQARGIAAIPYTNETPTDGAGINAAQPAFGDMELGGTIKLVPDPLLESVYIQAPPADFARVERALYFLLPSDDFARIRLSPGEYLCRGLVPGLGEKAEPAVQLPMDASMPALKGERLRFARTYMTQSVMAQRRVRLASLGLTPRVAFARDIEASGTAEEGRPGERLATLLIEHTGVPPEIDEIPVPDLKECETPRDSAPAARPTAGAKRHETVDKPAALPEQKTKRERAKDRPFRNHLEVSAEHRAGKSTRFGTTYRHDGLRPEDTFSIGLGLQQEGSSDVSYSGDFAYFHPWGRRVTWNAHVYSTFNPGVGVGGNLTDERRKGVELDTTTDLWRDVGQTFGQLEVGVRRVNVSLEERGRPVVTRDRVTALDTTLVVGRSVEATTAWPRDELNLGVTTGRANGARFGKVTLEGSMRRFIGAFQQWEVRVRASRMEPKTPTSEWARFGGEDTVRGYREDRVSARSIWAIQNEYWTPLPWLPSSTSDELRRKLRQNLALALLLDVGEARKSGSDFSGRKAGAGLGLRYFPDPAVALRLDVARPLGSVIESDRRTRIYFTVTAFRSL